MKFYMVVNYYLVNLSFKFHGDLCINACARVVNARAHDLSRVRFFSGKSIVTDHPSPPYWNFLLFFLTLPLALATVEKQAGSELCQAQEILMIGLKGRLPNTRPPELPFYKR